MAGLSVKHEEDIKLHTDHIIALCKTALVTTRELDIDVIEDALIAIRNSTLMIEDYIERCRERQR